MAKKDPRVMNEFATEVSWWTDEENQWVSQDKICVQKLQKNCQKCMLKFHLKI